MRSNAAVNADACPAAVLRRPQARAGYLNRWASKATLVVTRSQEAPCLCFG